MQPQLLGTLQQWPGQKMKLSTDVAFRWVECDVLHIGTKIFAKFHGIADYEFKYPVLPELILLSPASEGCGQPWV